MDKGLTAFDKVKLAIDKKQNFILEAGAGSGKTYTLMQTLLYLNKKKLIGQQRILCITFTNVAKDEIINRFNKERSFNSYYIATMHDFLWDFFSCFQIELRKEVKKLSILKTDKIKNDIKEAQRKLDKPRANTNIEKQKEIIKKGKDDLIKYENINFDHLNIKYDIYSSYYKGIISHEDIITIANNFFKDPFFLKMFICSFPYLLIDEYQDTNAELISTMVEYINKYNMSDRISIGLFGDRMQQIYDNNMELDFSLFDVIINKEDNFRSNLKIINANNHLRNDELKQNGDKQDPKVNFQKLSFVYNTSSDKDLKGYFKNDFEKYKRLYLSNSKIAEEIGFSTLSSLFQERYNVHSNEKLLKLDDPLLRFVIEEVITNINNYEENNYNKLLKKLKIKTVNQIEEYRIRISHLIKKEIVLKEYMKEYKQIFLFDDMKLKNIIASINDDSFIKRFFLINIREFICLHNQINNKTSLNTMHGVKGAEYQNVIVNVSEKQKWPKYNFDSLILGIDKDKDSIQRAHKLLYVACTRAKEGLVINYICKEYSLEQQNILKDRIIEMFGNEIEFIVLK